MGRPMTEAIYIGDFETTVYEGQQYTEVWASAIVQLNTEDVLILNSIGETYDYLESLNENIVIYYHNLKFDGAFWLSYLLDVRGMPQAYTIIDDDVNTIEFLKDKDMPKDSFKYLISDMGQWYTITVRFKSGKYLKIRDSLKLLPFSVKQIGKSFGTKHKKLEMEYTGFRFAGCLITDEEKAYIANDVLVVKEALEIMFKQGHKKLTIGSCCLQEYKKQVRSEYGKDGWKKLFPDVYEVEIDKSIYGSSNAGEYIRKSYKGGWCYLVKGKENKIYTNGVTADVNSLYPSVMSGESHNVYPIGLPTFWSGNYIPNEAIGNNKYYFVRIQTKFKIKKEKLPFLQIKGSPLYVGTECLETSDMFVRSDKRYSPVYYDGVEWKPCRPTLTLTMTDFTLLQEHYDLYDYEILDGCYFKARSGLFDFYINPYKELKQNSTGAMRTLAKLFLNNLYGKFASSPDSSFKVAYLKDDRTVGFYSVDGENKKTVYIPVGSAVTSYARLFTISRAQKNYYGKNKRGFIYADTDSIHCDLSAEELKGIKVHDTDFLHWKLESSWDKAIFVRQKTYIEHVTHENLKPVEKPFYQIKCAGMPDRCKQPIIEKLESGDMDLKEFKRGLTVDGKLLPKRIQGGIILQNTTYEMR